MRKRRSMRNVSIGEPTAKPPCKLAIHAAQRSCFNDRKMDSLGGLGNTVSQFANHGLPNSIRVALSNGPGTIPKTKVMTAQIAMATRIGDASTGIAGWNEPRR
jgi:hypothetical protein